MSHLSVADHLAHLPQGRIRTLIIGAGVAGLTLAALMHQRGEFPVVIERAKDFDHLGYMLGLYHLGSRVLHGLDLFEPYLDQSVTMQQYKIRNGTGKLIKGYSLQEINQRFGPIQGVSRAALINLLRQRVEASAMLMGTTAKGFDQRSGSVEVTFHDGSTAMFDLVVAADGLHSDTRKKVWKKTEYSYWETGWGGWVVWADPALAPDHIYTEYWGAGRFLGLYPTADRLGVFLGGPIPTLKQRGKEEFMHTALEKFSQQDPAISGLLEAIDRDPHPFFWDFHDCRTRPWRKGRIVLLGDAAAGFLPTAGIGASMAMESAAALNDELSRTNAAFVKQALTLYEKRHRQRVELAQDSSRQLGRMMFVKSSPLACLRNQLLRFYSLERLVSSIANLMEEPI